MSSFHYLVAFILVYCLKLASWMISTLFEKAVTLGLAVCALKYEGGKGQFYDNREQSDSSGADMGGWRVRKAEKRRVQGKMSGMEIDATSPGVQPNLV